MLTDEYITVIPSELSKKDFFTMSRSKYVKDIIDNYTVQTHTAICTIPKWMYNEIFNIKLYKIFN